MNKERMLSFRLEQEQYDFIRALSKANGVTVAETIRTALNQYISVGE